jgi:8-amino-7-oxononanoate synthase
MTFDQFLWSEIDRIKAAGLYRELRTVGSPQGAEMICDGRPLVNFSSNDYLGLAGDRRLAVAARGAVDDAGTGSGASRLISGNHRFHEALEEAVAGFKGCEAALTFSSGYAAAVGTLPALFGKSDVLILDKLSHASLVDGARLSGAVVRIFPHNHLEKLESHLRWAREKHPQAKVGVVIESVYSMDGDLAPLREIVELKNRFGAWLFLDEAHGVGVLGERGRGLADALGLAEEVEIQMGTFGKALGVAGAYICGRASLRDYLLNRARSFIFSTAPPPSVAMAARAAVELLNSNEGEILVARLREVRGTLAELLRFPGADSAIFPVLVGDERKAMAVSERLRKAGYFVPAVRFPTVAAGSARLRITVTAAHTREHLENFVRALEQALREE